jgi:hypothetical protein
MAPASPSADLSFLTGGGEMATLISGHDWAKSPVGRRKNGLLAFARPLA